MYHPRTLHRLASEIRSLLVNPPEGIILLNDNNAVVTKRRNNLNIEEEDDEEDDFISTIFSGEDSISDIKVRLQGPLETPYQNGAFNIKINIPLDYPQNPPKAHFLTRIFHPNVNMATGEICVNTLKKDWKPNLSLSHVLQVVRCLLIIPFPESSLNDEAGRLFMESYTEYYRRATIMTNVHAIPSPDVNSLSAKTRKINAPKTIKTKKIEKKNVRHPSNTGANPTTSSNNTDKKLMANISTIQDESNHSHTKNNDSYKIYSGNKDATVSLSSPFGSKMTLSPNGAASSTISRSSSPSISMTTGNLGVTSSSTCSCSCSSRTFLQVDKNSCESDEFFINDNNSDSVNPSSLALSTSSFSTEDTKVAINTAIATPPLPPPSSATTEDASSSNSSSNSSSSENGNLSSFPSSIFSSSSSSSTSALPLSPSVSYSSLLQLEASSTSINGRDIEQEKCSCNQLNKTISIDENNNSTSKLKDSGRNEVVTIFNENAEKELEKEIQKFHKQKHLEKSGGEDISDGIDKNLKKNSYIENNDDGNSERVSANNGHEHRSTSTSISNINPKKKLPNKLLSHHSSNSMSAIPSKKKKALKRL